MEFLPKQAECVVVVKQGLVDGCKALEDFRVGGELFPHFDEGANEEQAHLDRLRAVQDGCGHDGAVFGEGIGQSFRKFDPLEVVTICDHLPLFPIRQLKAEILRKALDVTFNSLVEHLGWGAINRGEVGIQQHFFGREQAE